MAAAAADAVGMRPINNIVDITNYVMLESGQPLHASDFATLRGGQPVVVRRPTGDETFITTLDGNERGLDAETLVICDAERPVAVAGMGGLETEITAATTDILLESACFDPVSIRRTARRMGIPSGPPTGSSAGLTRTWRTVPSSGRCSWWSNSPAARPNRAASMSTPDRKTRSTHPAYPAGVFLLGMDLERDEVARLLRSIGVPVTVIDEGHLAVTVPSSGSTSSARSTWSKRWPAWSATTTSPPPSRSSAWTIPSVTPCANCARRCRSCSLPRGISRRSTTALWPRIITTYCRLAVDDPRRQVTPAEPALG